MRLLAIGLMLGLVFVVVVAVLLAVVWASDAAAQAPTPPGQDKTATRTLEAGAKMLHALGPMDVCLAGPSSACTR